MRTVIFAEAIRLQQYMQEVGNIHNKISFEFKFPNEDVIIADIQIKENKTVLCCTCVHGSVNYEALCSHKLAVIYYLFRKQMRRLKKPW